MKRYVFAIGIVAALLLAASFSYVFAEALILETPLISTDVADIKKFIPSSFIVKPQSRDIAQKIESFFQNYGENLTLFKPAFKSAKEEFCMTSMTKKVINIYKKVLNEL